MAKEPDYEAIGRKAYADERRRLVMLLIDEGEYFDYILSTETRTNEELRAAYNRCFEGMDR